MTFDVYGNYGLLKVDNLSGEVLKYLPQEGEESAYHDIVRFDLENYNGQSEVDIIHIGFWTETGDYFEPMAH